MDVLLPIWNCRLSQLPETAKAFQERQVTLSATHQQLRISVANREICDSALSPRDSKRQNSVSG